MVIHVTSATVVGLSAYKIDVEVDTVNSLPQIAIIGLPDAAINEARERIRLSIKNSGFSFPRTKVVINLAPADLKKEGAGYDLAMAIGILAKDDSIPSNFSDTAFIGELSLDGVVRPVTGILPIVCSLAELGIKKVILPYDNLIEASFIDDIEVLGAKTLGEVVGYLKKENNLEKMTQNIDDYLNKSIDFDSDFKFVKGQKQAKYALEIAAAGNHNVVMYGAPGSGKTMLARAFTSIMPPLKREEALELTKIYSVTGLLNRKNPIVTKRPFRAPHHSASSIGIIGGGSVPKPGEITLAHRGVLFLDEMVEFQRTTLEALRQPLEDGRVTISRVNSSIEYPSNFILIGAMNPCPCGFLGDSVKKCVCNDFQIKRYRSKLSGPLLDRIDIQVEMPRLTQDELSDIKEDTESSADIRKRVIFAREVQAARYIKDEIKTNGDLTPKLIKKYCKLDIEATQLLRNAVNLYNLSARAYDRILKTSRTIADLESYENIEAKHIAKALQFKTLG